MIFGWLMVVVFGVHLLVVASQTHESSISLQIFCFPSAAPSVSAQHRQGAGKFKPYTSETVRKLFSGNICNGSCAWVISQDCLAIRMTFDQFCSAGLFSKSIMQLRGKDLQMPKRSAHRLCLCAFVVCPPWLATTELNDKKLCSCLFCLPEVQPAQQVDIAG